MINSWKAKWYGMLSEGEKKFCDWLYESQNNHKGKGWDKIAAKELEEAKKKGITLRKRSGEPHDARSYGRHIKNKVDDLLNRIKKGYTPEDS